GFLLVLELIGAGLWTSQRQVVDGLDVEDIHLSIRVPVGATVDLLNALDLDLRGIEEETIQRVVLALGAALHVDDDVAVVQQHPQSLAASLATQGLRAIFGQVILDFVNDGLHVALVIAGDDDEAVDDGQAIGYVDDEDVFALLLICRLGSETGEGDGFWLCG